MNKLYIHVDATGARLGNGGFKMLTSLAQNLSSEYEVYLFDHKDRLHTQLFDWLCLNEKLFSVVPFGTVKKDNAPIITSWLSPILGQIPIKRIMYWCQSELLRIDNEFDAVRDALKGKRIAINNRYLSKYYKSLGYTDLLYLDNWIDDRFQPGIKVENSIGHQSDNFHYDIAYSRLVDEFPNRVILCEGNQKEVAFNMSRSDYYLFFNRLTSLLGFDGETFGLSLFEAMASGCICIVRRNPGNEFLTGKVQFVSNLEQALLILKVGIKGLFDKEELRKNSLEFINSNYRFDNKRLQTVKELIEQ